MDGVSTVTPEYDPDEDYEQPVPAGSNMVPPPVPADTTRFEYGGRERQPRNTALTRGMLWVIVATVCFVLIATFGAISAAITPHSELQACIAAHGTWTRSGTAEVCSAR